MSENAEILLDIAEEKPIKDFDKYVNAACAIIKNSKPQYSIGIYGEWGTGKTTMMKGIQKKIKPNDKLVTVWFDAWRYENEEYHAAIPLLKKIAYSIDDNKSDFLSIREKLLTSTRIIGKNILSGIISKYISELDIDRIENELNQKISVLTKHEKNTIYFDGLEEIIKEMKDDSEKKIVIFIDDLDRCSPEKTIQILESTKAFLDIPGFVFVIGLSHDTTAVLIENKYKANNVNGKEYIKKIIQVPFHIQKWNESDTKDLIKHMATKLVLYYKTIVEDENTINKLILTLEKTPEK